MKYNWLNLLLGYLVLPVISISQAEKGRQSYALSDHILTRISPAMANCTEAEFPNECVNATQAASAINKAFEMYDISGLGERAGLVAYMLFESGNFTYNRNHYPGRPGQGTRMMAMPNIVKLYATSLVGTNAVTMAEAAGGAVGLDAVLELANSNEAKSTGSAAWFLSTQCPSSIKKGLNAKTIGGWHDFITECVHTDVSVERDTLWLATMLIMNSQG